GLLLAAAALKFAAWRVTGLARAGWAAIIFGFAGTAAPVLPVMTVLSPTPAGAGASLAHGVVQLTVICLAACAVATAPVVAPLRPVRVGIPLAGIAIAML